MTKALRLSTYEDPEEFARKGCQWHEENDGAPLTHKDVLIGRLGMKDPYAIEKAAILMKNLTAKDGEFEHLTAERKYVETSARTAEQRGVPHGRSVERLQGRRIKGIDDAVKSVSRMDHLPAELKESAQEMADAIVDGAGRMQNADRTADIVEFKREMCALADKHLGKAHARAERLEVELKAVREELKAARDEIGFLRPIVAAGRPGQPSGQGLVTT